MKQVLTGSGLLKSSGAYSQAILAKGTFLFTAGQIGRDPETGTMPEGIEAQTKQALANLLTVLRAAGGDLKHVVRMLVFLADLKEGPEFNRVYAEHFANEPPVRTRVQAGALSPGCLVEMEAIAVLPD